MKDSCLSCWCASKTTPLVLLPQGTDDQPAGPGLINSTSNGTGEEMVTGDFPLAFNVPRALMQVSNKNNIRKWRVNLTKS